MTFSADLPGADLVEQGLADLQAGRETACSFLVALASPRLRSLGLPVPEDVALPTEPERQLFRLLQREDPRRAHSSYNALIRRIVSFARCLDLKRRYKDSSSAV